MIGMVGEGNGTDRIWARWVVQCAFVPPASYEMINEIDTKLPLARTCCSILIMT